MQGITKRFPAVVANDHVDFEAAAGEVHALLGENGAGKTTLSNILTGLYRPDEGEIELFGKRVEFSSPRDALDAGVAMVHQHFRLVSPFTVAENVVLGDHRDVGRSFVLRPRAIEARVEELSHRYGLAVAPRARIWQLSVGEQQRVEILKALYKDARILILDEPTAVLTPQEAGALFETIRAMAADGRTIIFISHKLHEVKAVADRVTVLRRGQSVATVPAAGATPRSLASLMVGHEIEAGRRQEGVSEPGEAVLELEEVWADGDRGVAALRDVSLNVCAGEIVGVAGVAGNGQRELAETIAGMRPATAGKVRVAGRSVRNGDPRAAIGAGVAYVPEDRLGTGVAPGLSVASNVVLKAYRKPGMSLAPCCACGASVSPPSVSSSVTTYARRARMFRPGNCRAQPAEGRARAGVLREPVALVAAAPTRGLDVAGSRRCIVPGELPRGVAVLLISETSTRSSCSPTESRSCTRARSPGSVTHASRPSRDRAVDGRRRD